MGSSVFGQKLNARNQFANGFRPLVTFDGAEPSSEAMLASFLEYTITTAREVFDASSVSLMLLDDNEELVIQVSTGIAPDVVREARRKLGEGISGWVAKNARALLLNGPINDTKFKGIDPTINGALSVPLIVNDKAIGVLNLSTRRPGATFSRRDLQVASFVAVSLATTIESMLIHKEVEEDSKQLLMLFEMERSLNAATSTQAITDVATSMLKDFTAADICIMLELQDKEWLLRSTNYENGTAGTELRFAPKNNGWLERCLANGNAEVITRVELAAENLEWIPSEITNLFVMPLLSPKRPIGIIVCGRDNDNPFDAKTLTYTSTLSTQIVTAWDTAHNRERWAEEITSKERNRIAQELHDSLAQELLGLVLALESCQMTLNQDQNTVQAQLAKATRIARGCLSDVRQYMTGLRSDRNETSGLVGRMERLIEEFRRQTGMPVDLSITGADVNLQPAVQQALLRIAQEALTNTRKHANAANVRLQVTLESQSGSMSVIDDGVGFNVDKISETAPGEGKYGLLGMRERATSIGATVDITSAPGKGTATYVRIPLGRVAGESRQDNVNDAGVRPSPAII